MRRDIEQRTTRFENREKLRGRAEEIGSLMEF